MKHLNFAPYTINKEIFLFYFLFFSTLCWFAVWWSLKNKQQDVRHMKRLLRDLKSTKHHTESAKSGVQCAQKGKSIMFVPTETRRTGRHFFSGPAILTHTAPVHPTRLLTGRPGHNNWHAPVPLVRERRVVTCARCTGWRYATQAATSANRGLKISGRFGIYPSYTARSSLLGNTLNLYKIGYEKAYLSTSKV